MENFPVLENVGGTECGTSIENVDKKQVFDGMDNDADPEISSSVAVRPRMRLLPITKRRSVEENISSDSEEGEQEDPGDYESGGYYKVVVDQVYHDRYRVIRKIGWGSFSTVWLGWDTTENQYVALKISKSDQIFMDACKDEVDILKAVEEADPADANRGKIVRLLDSFDIYGPEDRSHAVLVMEVQGCNLLSILNNSKFRGIPLAIVKNIIAQILQGLSYLHTKCGVIHTDVKPENVLVAASKEYVQSLVSEIEESRKRGSKISSSMKTNHQASFSKKVKIKDILRKYRDDKIFDKEEFLAKRPPVNGNQSTWVRYQKLLERDSFADRRDSDSDGSCDSNESNTYPDEDYSSYTNENNNSKAYDNLNESNISSEAEESKYSDQSNDSISKPTEEGKHSDRASDTILTQMEEGKHSDRASDTILTQMEAGKHSDRASDTILTLMEAGKHSDRASDTIRTQMEAGKHSDRASDTIRSQMETGKHSDRASNTIRSQMEAGKHSDQASDSILSDEDEQPQLKRPRIAQSHKQNSSHITKYEVKIRDRVITLTSEMDVKLADLGNACYVDHHFSDAIQTRHYRSLEAIIGAEYNEKTDIWSVACLAYELATGDHLFTSQDGRNLSRSKDVRHLTTIIQLLGPVPASVSSKATKLHLINEYDGSFKWNISSTRKTTSIKDLLIRKHHWNEKNAREFQDFLVPMLDYDIDSRVSASDMLTHPWLK